MICEKSVVRAKPQMLDMVQLEKAGICVCVAIGKCSDAVVILLRESNFEDSSI